MHRLSLGEAEQILIGQDVTITLVRGEGTEVRVAIDAPSHVPIWRRDILASPPRPLPLEIETWPVVTVSDQASLEFAKQRNPAA